MVLLLQAAGLDGDVLALSLCPQCPAVQSGSCSLCRAQAPDGQVEVCVPVLCGRTTTPAMRWGSRRRLRGKARRTALRQWSLLLDAGSLSLPTIHPRNDSIIAMFARLVCHRGSRRWLSQLPQSAAMCSLAPAARSPRPRRLRVPDCPALCAQHLKGKLGDGEAFSVGEA